MTIFRYGVRGIDYFVRRYYGVAPFTQHPDCILRISSSRAGSEILLSDGILVEAFDEVCDVHLWNERLEVLLRNRSTLGWGRQIVRRLQASLRLLADWIRTNPELPPWVAVRGVYGFVTDATAAKAVLEGVGFDARFKEHAGPRFWTRPFWDQLYSLGLMWAFHPENMVGKQLRGLRRVEFWMSSERLEDRYGS